MKNFFSRGVIFVVVCGALVQLFVAHLLSGRGEELAVLEEKTQLTSGANRNLKSELYKYSSLVEIAARVEEFGYIRPQKVVYFNEESSTAFLGLNNNLELLGR